MAKSVTSLSSTRRRRRVKEKWSGELMIEDRTSDRLTTLQVHDNTEKTSQVPSIYNMGDEQPRKRAIPRLANDKWTIEIIFTSIKTKDEKPRKGLTFCLEWCRDFANPEHYWPAGAAESLENTRQKTAERFSNCLHYYRDPSKELENEPYFTKTSHAVDLATGQLWVVRKYKDDTIKANELEIMSKLKAEFSSIVACLDFPNAGVRMEPDNGNLYDLVKGYCGKEPSNRPPGIWFGSAIRDILTALAILEDNGISHRNISMKSILVYDVDPVEDMYLFKLGHFGYGRDMAKKTKDPVAMPMPKHSDSLYVAPEIKAGGEHDTRSDVWSFGAVLCEVQRLLSNQVERPSAEDWQKKHAGSGNELAKMLAPKPGDRITASDLEDEYGNETPFPTQHFLAILPRTNNNAPAPSNRQPAIHDQGTQHVLPSQPPPRAPSTAAGHDPKAADPKAKVSTTTTAKPTTAKPAVAPQKDKPVQNEGPEQHRTGP
ncbi:kinase-like domain-containing protein [Lasiosphaeria ovina]|uniref:Kinase-like domain-containing protein n=1 Tax=Lasiosphaeria ovina TaxID=92902 RepID=A0AAE0N3M7_9PEZI|nr:kinase-like domain-containing protein [Lasiosphaeria ovina]